MVETNWSRDGSRLISDNLRRGCRLQDRYVVQGRGGSRQHVVAHRRGGRAVQLARGGIRDHEAFLDHEMKGPVGTGRGGISMAGGRQEQGTEKGDWVRGHGGRQDQGAEKGDWVRGHRLPSPLFFVLRIYLCILVFLSR